MIQKIGIVYSSVDGQTKKICEHLHQCIKSEQIEAELWSIDEFGDDITTYHTLVIGASIRYGKHNDNVYEFITNHIEAFKNIQTAFFSVNLVARKKDKNSPSTNPYMIKFLNTTQWKPDFLEVFAGKLDYKSYTFFDNLMIKLIMKFTNGPTKSKQPIEYTDWKKVNDFGLKLVQNYKATKTDH